jgi:imidazolonepropionase-like amidohydrolase
VALTAALVLVFIIVSGARQPDAVSITRVSIVDVLNGRVLPNRSVTIKGETIVSISAGGATPRGTRIVDGQGKFLIPGLWDMHTHLEATGPSALDLHLANGVTGIRDMGSAPDIVFPMRERIRRGELSGPQIVAAGPILDNAPADWPFRRRVTTAQDAREAVRDLKQRGADFIKVHTNTPRDAFLAIADETRRLGLPFAGHVPRAITIAESATSGIASIEHLGEFRLFRECGERAPTYDAASCRGLFERLVAHHVWQTPTLDFFRVLPEVFSGKPLPHAEYASDSLLEMTRKNREGSKLDDAALAFFRSMGHTSLTVIRDMHAAGTSFLAGCDGTVPGFCLHDEMQAFTDAGFSPLQALQTATINPARFLGRQKTEGTIDIGKRADLVLLNADPLADIRNTRMIAAVIVRGRVLQSADLDRLLAAQRRGTK